MPLADTQEAPSSGDVPDGGASDVQTCSDGKPSPADEKAEEGRKPSLLRVLLGQQGKADTAEDGNGAYHKAQGDGFGQQYHGKDSRDERHAELNDGRADKAVAGHDGVPEGIA